MDRIVLDICDPNNGNEIDRRRDDGYFDIVSGQRPGKDSPISRSRDTESSIYIQSRLDCSLLGMAQHRMRLACGFTFSSREDGRF